MGQEYGERFHRARREEQRLEAALHALTPEEIPEEAEREELLKYIGYRKRSAVQMLIRQGNLPGLKAMKERAGSRSSIYPAIGSWQLVCGKWKSGPGFIRRTAGKKTEKI